MPRLPNGVDTLITIDPVGRLRPSWVSVRGKCRRWLDVRAEPSTRNWHWNSDGISALGGQYPPPPGPSRPGALNYALAVDLTHADFWPMMRATTREGISGASLLGGTRVG